MFSWSLKTGDLYVRAGPKEHRHPAYTTPRGKSSSAKDPSILQRSCPDPRDLHCRFAFTSPTVPRLRRRCRRMCATVCILVARTSAYAKQEHITGTPTLRSARFAHEKAIPHDRLFSKYFSPIWSLSNPAVGTRCASLCLSWISSVHVVKIAGRTFVLDVGRHSLCHHRGATRCPRTRLHRVEL